MKTYEWTVDEIAERCADIAVVPVGSLEQHGHHLPVDTDIVIAQAVADRVGEALGAYVLPCLPVSTCREHMGKRGSVWMNPDTFYRMLSEVVLCLHEQGFKKVVVVQGHGGIFVMPAVIRQLNATMNPGLMVCKLEPYNFVKNLVDERILESAASLHADEFETSLMLALQPHAVHMDKAVDFVPDVPREFLGYGSIFRACPDGVWGEPSRATAEKGEKALARITQLSIGYIHAVFDYIGKKEPFGYSKF